jgi:glycogen synthase
LHRYAAALEFLLKTGRQPDILHCHDWSTAEVAPVRPLHKLNAANPQL